MYARTNGRNYSASPMIPAARARARNLALRLLSASDSQGRSWTSAHTMCTKLHCVTRSDIRALSVERWTFPFTSIKNGSLTSRYESGGGINTASRCKGARVFLQFLKAPLFLEHIRSKIIASNIKSIYFKIKYFFYQVGDSNFSRAAYLAIFVSSSRIYISPFSVRFYCFSGAAVSGIVNI